MAELALKSKHSCPGKTLTLMKPSPSRARLNMHKHARHQPPGSAQHPWSQALEGNATCTISLAAHHLSQEFPTLRQSLSQAREAVAGVGASCVSPQCPWWALHFSPPKNGPRAFPPWPFSTPPPG